MAEKGGGRSLKPLATLHHHPKQREEHWCSAHRLLFLQATHNQFVRLCDPQYVRESPHIAESNQGLPPPCWHTNRPISRLLDSVKWTADANHHSGSHSTRESDLKQQLGTQLYNPEPPESLPKRSISLSLNCPWIQPFLKPPTL